MLECTDPGGGGGGYSQYSDDGDDRRIWGGGVVVGDLVFFRGCSSKIILKDKTGISLGIKTDLLNTLF